MSLKVILKQACNRDPSACNLLYRKYYNLIFRWVVRKNIPLDQAKIISLESFQQALHKLDRFVCDPALDENALEQHFVAWLRKFAQYRLSTYFKQQKKDKKRLTSLDSPLGSTYFSLSHILADDGLLPDQEVILNEQLQILKGWMTTLDCWEHELIELRYYRKMSYKEISDFHFKGRRSEAALRKALQRIQQKLQNHILANALDEFCAQKRQHRRNGIKPSVALFVETHPFSNCLRQALETALHEEWEWFKYFQNLSADAKKEVLDQLRKADKLLLHKRFILKRMYQEISGNQHQVWRVRRQILSALDQASNRLAFGGVK